MTDSQSFFAFKKPILWLVLAGLFGLGLAIRLYDLTDVPLDFHATRQLHSAVMARGIYYENLPGIPEWQREMAVQQWKAEGLIEPPILEHLAAFTYRVMGGELLWVARLYSIFFWMLGSVFLFLLARDLTSADGAVVAFAYFLILPYGAIASRAFQPDPLMTFAIIAAVWAINRWSVRPIWKWAILAGLLGGFAILVKAVAVFFIGGAWLGLMLSDWRIKMAWRDKQVWLMGGLTVLPYAVFHIYGVYISGLLQSQFSLRFFPQMWLDPLFYLRWNGQISSVVGFEWFLMAALGIFLIRNRPQRGIVIGLWAGYFLYGLALPHHISTHDYYQLPFIPLVALGLAAGAALLLQNLRGPRPLLLAVVYGVLLFGVVIKAWDVRVTLKRQDFRSEVAFWHSLGEKIGPGTAVIGLTHDYGFRLSYWGWVNSTNWMTSADFNYRAMAGQEFDMQALFEEQVSGKKYFVVTLFNELEKQPELENLLRRGYPVYAQADDYLIYDLKNPLPPAGAALPLTKAQ